jgi:regulation of enolase protein 1 (concanavalin A-like superfamily)
MWDGVYLGAGSIANPTGTDGVAAGTVSVANANITAAGALSVTSLNTDWENAADDGFLLFKVITGDFDMSVRVVTPFNSNAYNLAGLMVRAFGAGGSPTPNSAENSFLWARFNEFSIANMFKNNVNGAKTDNGEGIYPNTNYWLRITRAGNNFNLFERGPATAAWTNVAAFSRVDLAGLPLEVGIEQADFAGGASLPAEFASFTLIVSNQIAGAAPTADTALLATANTNGSATLAWSPGNGSGSVVVLWTGNPAIQEAPANGTTYTGNANYGSGSSLPATNYFVVYAGGGTNVTVSNLASGTMYYAAAFGYSGSGSSLTYTHTATTVNFTPQSSGGGGGTSVTFADNFSTSVNYLQNGLMGTIWDGVYFGSGEFDNTSGGEASTLQCDANISAAGALTLQTTGTGWEGADDDGFFLFKVVPGDFSAVVEVNTPFNNAGYNTAGLVARAFSSNGNAYNGSENFISWTRFDEYNFANYLRNNVDGGVTQINPGDYPNGSYWLRIDRVHGTNFMFYQRTNAASAWELETFPAPVSGTILTRTDFAGLPLQVGIMHATFAGQLGVSFSNFSLTESNATFAATPSPASNLLMATNANETLSLSWTPATASAGSAVVLWTSTNLVKETPANGFTYTGSANYGSGSALPGATYFMVYVGTNSSVTVSNVLPGTTYYAGVYSYAGSGTNTSYSHAPATASLAIPLRNVSSAIVLSNGDVYVNFTANPGEWYWLQYSDSLSPANWQNVGLLPTIATNLLMTLVHQGGVGSSQRFYRLLQMEPEFDTQSGDGVMTSLMRNNDVTNTQYLSGPLEP